MHDFDPSQGLRRHLGSAVALIVVAMLPFWVGWHIPDIAFSDFAAGADHAEVLRLDPEPGGEYGHPGVWVRYEDEDGATHTQRLDLDDDDRREDLRPGRRTWVWFVRDRPNMTQLSAAEPLARGIFAVIGGPVLLGGLGLVLWTLREYRQRRRALREWPRLPIALPRLEFSRDDAVLPAPLRRCRLHGRVFHGNEWRDVRSTYVITRDTPDLNPAKLPPVLVDPSHPQRYWLPIPADWLAKNRQ